LATIDAGSVVAVARDHARYRPSAPRGGDWVIAVGPPVTASSADRSARGAEMASRVAPRCFRPKVVRHEDLGILGAMAVVPWARPSRARPRCGRSSAGTPSGLEELRALEALCAREASRRRERDLRAHHGTVARRLDRGFAATALDCQDPEHRFTVQLAVYLGALGSR
jgi:hypothetical protein